MDVDDYEYTVSECDVSCPETLKRFREKRNEWLNWLRHDPHHAITDQISHMLWSDAVFRLINESRKHARDAPEEYATQSGVLAEALDRGYVAGQLIAFRRLLERAASDRKKQIISLRRLVDDLYESRAIVTRENFVCYDGLPFDDRGGLDDLPPPDESGVSVAWVSTSGPRAFGMANLQHQSFDSMMDTRPDRRLRDDHIGNRFFNEIEETLQKAPFEHARKHANKLLLHAADAHSRGSAPIPGISLDQIWACHRAILMVTNRISIAIDGPNIGAVPTPQFDVLDKWSAPFAPEAAFRPMLDDWHRENAAREAWTQELFNKRP